jgi:tRNA pseudouridine32 synthase/23S rRNA pseudouridine746 synthase
MLKGRRGSWKLAKTADDPAVTRFFSAALREGERAFLVRPFTGKTHQIRVALKSLGSPVAGDPRYADSTEARKEDRGYLHAYALRFRFREETFSFVHPPLEGERFLSEPFRRQLAAWENPWELF